MVFKETCELNQDFGKFTIARKSGGRIADGQKVLATYEVHPGGLRRDVPGRA